MSGEQARAAWKRLWLTLPRAARKEWFGLPYTTFYEIKKGRCPSRRTLLRVARKYDLDPAFVLEGRLASDCLGEFPLAACQYRYSQLVGAARLRLFSHVALHQFHEVLDHFPQATFQIENPHRAVIRIEINANTSFEVICFADEFSMVFSLQMTIGNLTKFLLFAQEGQYCMAEFRPIIAAHINAKKSKINAFERARKQSEDHMSWQHN